MDKCLRWRTESHIYTIKGCYYRLAAGSLNVNSFVIRPPNNYRLIVRLSASVWLFMVSILLSSDFPLQTFFSVRRQMGDFFFPIHFLLCYVSSCLLTKCRIVRAAPCLSVPVFQWKAHGFGRERSRLSEHERLDTKTSKACVVDMHL